MPSDTPKAPSKRALRAELLRVIGSPQELRIWLSDAGIPLHKLNPSGSMLEQVDGALKLMATSLPEQVRAFYQIIREEYPGADLPQVDRAIAALESSPREDSAGGAPPRGSSLPWPLTPAHKKRLLEVLTQRVTNAQLSTILQLSGIPAHELPSDSATQRDRANGALAWISRQGPEELRGLIEAIAYEVKGFDLS